MTAQPSEHENASDWDAVGARVSPEALREVLERLPKREAMDCPAWAERLVERRDRELHPERAGMAPAEALGWALADLWRECFLPERMEAEFRVRWHTFLVLEVAYFHPFRRRGGAPRTLSELGRLLSDERHLALVIMEGDAESAEALLDEGHAPFWQAVVPDVAAGPVAASTVFNRRETALRRLAEELNRWAPPPDSPRSPPALAEAPMTAPERAEGMALYRSRCLPPEPAPLPLEWSAFFEVALSWPRLFVHARAGEGKSAFLAALAHWLRRYGSEVLVLPVRDYARVAREMSPLQFVVEEGEFADLGGDEALGKELREALARAEQDERLWVLADEADDLLEAECGAVADRLAVFRHLVLAERSPRLGHLLGEGEAIRLPSPSVKAFEAFLGRTASAREKPAARPRDLLPGPDPGAAPLAWYDLAARMWAEDEDHYHPAVVTEAWVHRRLLKARAIPGAGAVATSVAFLQELAGQKIGLADFGCAATLTADVLTRSARLARAEVDPLVLADHAHRAGLLELDGTREWRFAHRLVETYFGAKYAATHPPGWAVMGRRFRPVMRWAAALLARRGNEAETRAFFESILGLTLDRLGLRWLDLADLLVEFEGFPWQVATDLKVEVEERLSLLAGVGSGRLRQAAVEKARRLGLDLGVDGGSAPEEGFAADLSPWRSDLEELLSRLGATTSGADAGAALEDREVLRALVYCGLTHDDPDVALSSAAWLGESSLSPVISVQVIPPRFSDALGEIAAMAIDPALPEATRAAAWSALRRGEFIPRLAAKGGRYYPQVYTLCLEMDERVWRTREGEWALLG